VTLPDNGGNHEYPLTITGADTTDAPLLAFADQTPKAYPPVDATPSNAGDTAHTLAVGSVEMIWKITTPGKSVCLPDQGGVVCTMQAPEPAKGQPAPPAKALTGRAILRPLGGNQSDPSAQSLLLDDFGVPSATHTGQHFLLNGAFEFIVEPDSNDVNICGGGGSGSCDAPPPPRPVTVSVAISVKKNVRDAENICEVTATYQQAAYRLEIQPASLCQSVREFEETDDVSAVCESYVSSAYDWLKAGTVQSTLVMKPGPMALSDLAGYWDNIGYLEEAHDFCIIAYQSYPNPWVRNKCDMESMKIIAPAPVSNDKGMYYGYTGNSSISCSGWTQIAQEYATGVNGGSAPAYTSEGKRIVIEGFEEVVITSEYDMMTPLISCTYTQEPEKTLSFPIREIAVSLSPTVVSVSERP